MKKRPLTSLRSGAEARWIVVLAPASAVSMKGRSSGTSSRWARPGSSAPNPVLTNPGCRADDRGDKAREAMAALPRPADHLSRSGFHLGRRYAPGSMKTGLPLKRWPTTCCLIASRSVPSGNTCSGRPSRSCGRPTSCRTLGRGSPRRRRRSGGLQRRSWISPSVTRHECRSATNGPPPMMRPKGLGFGRGSIRSRQERPGRCKEDARDSLDDRTTRVGRGKSRRIEISGLCGTTREGRSHRGAPPLCRRASEFIELSENSAKPSNRP